MTKKTSYEYEATARREGRWWIITVPELDAVTQARNVPEIDEMVTGLVASLLDVDEGDVRVTVRIEIPESVAEAWREAQQLQAKADEEVRQAAALRRQVVKALLTDEKLTPGDAGAVLGVSRQRVQQLVKSRQ